MSRYRDWSSGFYEDAFANPPKNPLSELEEVNSMSGLGQNDTLQADTLRASCEIIVKLSQEGSTYYSSIRDHSSQNSFPEKRVPVRDKVSSWVNQNPIEVRDIEEENCAGLRKPYTVTKQSSQNRSEAGPSRSPPEDGIITELRKYRVPNDQVKILVNNVPPSSTKECLREMLSQYFDKIYSLEHHETQMIAITSRTGSAQFASLFDGAVLDNMFPTPLLIYVID